jgi:small subunit ribosomal protein S16
LAVHIRLKRFGSKNKVYWRVVVADSRMPRDGKFLEEVGHYQSRTNPAKIDLKLERIQYWISKGAKMSDTVKSLVKKEKAKSA